MITLPFAPLTRDALQQRVEHEKSSIAWYVSACTEAAVDFTDADLAYLSKRGANLRAYHAADMTRMTS